MDPFEMTPDQSAVVSLAEISGACSRMSRHIENYDRSNLAGTEVAESPFGPVLKKTPYLFSGKTVRKNQSNPH